MTKILCPQELLSLIQNRILNQTEKALRFLYTSQLNSLSIAIVLGHMESYKSIEDDLDANMEQYSFKSPNRATA